MFILNRTGAKINKKNEICKDNTALTIYFYIVRAVLSQIHLTFLPYFMGTISVLKKFMFAAIAAMVMVSVSNVFASSRMVGNAEVAPVDTVAPDAPSDTTEVGTPIQPQATTEDSTQQETTQLQEGYRD